MARGPALSAVEKELLWERWRRGDTLADIGRALGTRSCTPFRAIRRSGGFAPPPRRRSVLALTALEREEISRGLVAELSIRKIALKLGRAASTVSREIARHGGRRRYRAAAADREAWKNAKRPKLCLLALNLGLRSVVARTLQCRWSPQQISGWLALTYAGEDSMQVSHETIYRSLFIQARGVLKKELLEHLRGRRVMRRSLRSSTKGQGRGHFEGVSIRERPAEVEDRAVPGHWEGDLIFGSRNTHIATLVERHSRFTMLIKVDGRDTVSVVTALSKQVSKLPAQLRRSLTWDRGKEMASHKKFTVATQAQVYFCDPCSPWQRGTNENTNRLLRQYFPANTELSGYSQADLNKIALQLNQRPRKTLGFHTPADTFQQSVASIH